MDRAGERYVTCSETVDGDEVEDTTPTYDEVGASSRTASVALEADSGGGLARALVDGKIAYVDRRLRIRGRTRYDWGDRLAHGHAEVCVGCRSVPVGNGEHSMMSGGRWGVIDTTGREIVPVTLSKAAFAARKDGER